MPFVKNPQPMKHYKVTFYLTGTDRDGNPISQEPVSNFNWTILARDEEHAADKIQDRFIEGVYINVTQCEEITQQ